MQGQERWFWRSAVVGILAIGTIPAAWGEQAAEERSHRFQLTSFQDREEVVAESTTVTTVATGERHDITGPISLRVADALPPGELEIKNVFGWGTRKGGGSDEWEYEFELEYGLIENHQLLFSLPLELGEG